MAGAEGKAPSADSQFHMIRGVPFAKIMNKELIEEALDYQPLDGDVIICSYPKTGTTWMQYIVQQILTKGEDIPDMKHMMEKVIPFLEMAGVAALDTITTKPRVYKHHLPFNMVKKNPNAKVIYIYRKPDDTFVSYFHFMNGIIGGFLNFDQFFEGFVSGLVSYGRYFEHIVSFLEHAQDENVCLVSYEELKLHPKEGILKLAKFLGQEYYDAITGDETVLNKILEHTSFEYMKKNLKFEMPKDPNTKDKFARDVPMREVNFFRKGTIGDGKNSLSEEQFNRVKKLAEEVMKGTDVLADWYGH